MLPPPRRLVVRSEFQHILSLAMVAILLVVHARGAFADTSFDTLDFPNADASSRSPRRPDRDDRVHTVDLQFFGDFYVPRSVLEDDPPPAFFAGLTEQLATSRHNIVNFEGAATDAAFPLIRKEYLLRMPKAVAKLLADAKIGIATLANNHALDYGQAGLEDSLRVLRQAGIATVGAGMHAAEAERPLIFQSGDRTVCLAAFSRTLPDVFWATLNRAGSAFGSHEAIALAARTCRAQGHFTVITFHWGRESMDTPIGYQRALARFAIDNGADTVIGHHPHVIQEIEVYKGHPIFYSLGNFVFGSRPEGTTPSGLLVRIALPPPPARPRWELQALDVNNHRVRFAPQANTTRSFFHPSLMDLVAQRRCTFARDQARWICRFEGG